MESLVSRVEEQERMRESIIAAFRWVMEDIEARQEAISEICNYAVEKGGFTSEQIDSLYIQAM